MNAPCRCSKSHFFGQGFGVVELMIALLLGTVIILGVSSLFSDSNRALTDISRAGRQLENSLYAADLLAKELSLVGYWGEADGPIDADDPANGVLRASEIAGLEIDPYPATPPICVGTGATGFDPRVELGWAMEFPLLSGSGSELNAAVNSNQCSVGASVASSTSSYLAVRRASTCATGVGGIAESNRCRGVDNFFYLQTNGCYDENRGLVGGEVKLYPANGTNINSLLDYERYRCDPSEMAPIYRYVSRIYYVNHNDQLVRLSLDNSEGGGIGYVHEVMVEGVEHLEFEWFIDDTGAGKYTRVERTLSHSDAVNVVGVNVWLVVRGMQSRPGFVDDFNYVVAGESWAVPSGNVSFSRTLQSRMVRLENNGVSTR